MDHRHGNGTAKAGSQHALIFEDHFEGSELDRRNWLPHYLPHWTTPEAALARFRIDNSVLRLVIDADQPAWAPDIHGDLKVSNLQTGHFSGPPGSAVGQHRSQDGLIVRSHFPETRLFLPHYCRLEMRARARLNSWNLAALWLIGFEDQPDCSGEITVFEAFGHNVGDTSARIGRGIKPIRDDRLDLEFDEGELPVRVEDWNTYAIDWRPGGVDFYVNGILVTRSRQSPDYPMQLMLNLYDLPSATPRGEARDAWFDIDYVRAWS